MRNIINADLQQIWNFRRIEIFNNRLKDSDITRKDKNLIDVYVLKGLLEQETSKDKACLSMIEVSKLLRNVDTVKVYLNIEIAFQMTLHTSY